jgi:DNA-binding LytR/AlgR family response regulator
MDSEDNDINQSFSHPVKLKVNTSKGIYYINIVEILYIKAENKYSIIYFVDSECIKTNHLLRWYGTHLKEPYFCRCHYSAIVNCRYIVCICGNMAVLKGNNKVRISRMKRRRLENLLLNH